MRRTEPSPGMMPPSTSSSSDWPLPATPAMPRISPARTWNDTPLSRSTPLSSVTRRFSTSSTIGPGWRGLLVDAQQHLAADHQLGQLLGAGLGGLDGRGHLAAAHDADGVGDLHDLAQLVGDQDDRLALAAQAVEDAEQVVGLGRGQHARRLVEDQDVGVAVERLEDLDPLLHADADVLDQRVGIDAELVFLAEFVQELARLGERGAQEAAVLGAQHDVFQHGEVLDQLEVLEHHADAGADGGLAVGDLGLLAVDEDLAGVGPVEAVEDRHQGRLAGAVLADDAVDRARHDADRDVLVGLDGAEGLGDAAQLDRRGPGLPGGGWGGVVPPRPVVGGQTQLSGQVLSVV